MQFRFCAFDSAYRAHFAGGVSLGSLKNSRAIGHKHPHHSAWSRVEARRRAQRAPLGPPVFSAWREAAHRLAWLMLDDRQASVARSARELRSLAANAGSGSGSSSHHQIERGCSDKVQARIHLAGRVHAVPNLRGKTQIKDSTRFPTLEQLPLWGFDGSSTMQAEGRSSDCVLKPVAVYPDSERKDGVLVMCEVMMPDGKTPHADQQARHHPRRSGRLVRLRAGILPVQGRPPARLPRDRLSGSARPLLHRRRLQERRQHRAQDRRGASRSVPRRRHQPRRHQRRSGEGPVGIPDLRQGLQKGRRRSLDGALPAASG